MKFLGIFTKIFHQHGKEVSSEIEDSVSIGDIIKIPGATYISEGIHLEYNSSMTIPEAKSIIGRTVVSLRSEEFSLSLKFDNGDELVIIGMTVDSEDNADSLDIRINKNILNI